MYVELSDDSDTATSAVVQQEMIRGQSGRMVKVDSLAGKTASRTIECTGGYS
jgi:hypothetical protein